MRWSDLLGTVFATFKIGFNKSTLDASAITQPRQHTLPDASGTLALTSQLGGGGGASGTATITFGSDRTMARASIASASITDTSVIRVSAAGAGTAQHSADEHLIENYSVKPANVQPGVGFYLVMQSQDKFGLSGAWSFKWSY